MFSKFIVKKEVNHKMFEKRIIKPQAHSLEAALHRCFVKKRLKP